MRLLLYTEAQPKGVALLDTRLTRPPARDDDIIHRHLTAGCVVYLYRAVQRNECPITYRYHFLCGLNLPCKGTHISCTTERKA